MRMRVLARAARVCMRGTLRLVARLSFVLQRVVPQDSQAFKAFCDELFEQKAGSALVPFDWAKMFIASALKWPIAARAFCAATSPAACAPGLSPARILASGLLVATETCDGQAMEAMHEQISRTGHAGSQTGLI